MIVREAANDIEKKSVRAFSYFFVLRYKVCVKYVSFITINSDKLATENVMLFRSMISFNLRNCFSFDNFTKKVYQPKNGIKAVAFFFHDVESN